MTKLLGQGNAFCQNSSSFSAFDWRSVLQEQVDSLRQNFDAAAAQATSLETRVNDLKQVRIVIIEPHTTSVKLLDVNASPALERREHALLRALLSRSWEIVQAQKSSFITPKWYVCACLQGIRDIESHMLQASAAIS